MKASYEKRKIGLLRMNMRGFAGGLVLLVIQAFWPLGIAQGATNLLTNGDLENLQNTFVADGAMLFYLCEN